MGNILFKFRNIKDMEGVQTIALGAIASLQAESVNAQKYMIVFDKNGNCGTFFEYKASRYQISKEMMKIAMQQQTEDGVSETLRKAIVGGALHGKCVVFDLGKVKGGILARQPAAADVWPADKIWNFAEWRKEENHMAIVREDENKSMLGSPGAYSLNSNFTIIILADYESEEKCQELINTLPHSQDFMVRYV